MYYSHACPSANERSGAVRAWISGERERGALCRAAAAAVSVFVLCPGRELCLLPGRPQNAVFLYFCTAGLPEFAPAGDPMGLLVDGIA